MKEIISITGSSSYLGQNVLKSLKKNNFFIKLSSRKINSKNKQHKIYIGNLTNRKFVNDLISSASYLINLAYNKENHKENLLITDNIISAVNNSKKIKKIIHVSTAMVSTNNIIDKVSENTNNKLKNEYQNTKLLIEKKFQDNLSKKIDLIILRPTEISDYKNNKSTIHSFRKKCDNRFFKSKILHFFLGARILNFVSIKNVSSVIIFFIKKKFLIKKRNIFFISEDSEIKNFSYYYKFIQKKSSTSNFFLKNMLYCKILKFLFISILNKENPFQIYSNQKLKNVGFQFKFSVKDQILKLKI